MTFSATIKLVRIKLLILTFLSLSFGVKAIFANDPPTLSNPSNNSTVTSSTLNWQTPSYSLYNSSPYRVQVDNDSGFGSVNKDYYTSNTHYSPSLSKGTWYWRVKAKDTAGTWSNWSSIWSFILADSTSSPTPTPTATSTPTPTPSLSPTSTPSNSPTSSFTISNVPSQINSDQSFNVSANLSLPNNPNTLFYLKGAFKKSDGSNYFGLTKVSGNWPKNGSTYSNQFPITTDPSGNWSGNLEVKPDKEDSGFTGTSDYIFKVGRYTSSGSGPTWSNEVTINIVSTNVNTDQGSPDQTINTTSSSSTSPDSAKSQTIPTSQTTSNSRVTSKPKINYQVATIAGISSSSTQAATPSSKVEVKNQKQINPFLLVGIGLVFAGAGSLGYIYLKRR